MSLIIAQIDVREPTDVAAAFNFSRETNTTLVIKNTGVSTNIFIRFRKAMSYNSCSTTIKAAAALRTLLLCG